MNHDVFISYSSKNSTAAQAICHELEDSGIKCWMAPRDITGGKEYGDLIDEAILTCRVFLLVYSADSLSSQWCKGELNVAFSEGKTIIPYRIDPTPLKGAMRVMLNQTHWIDAYPNYKTCFKDLVTAVGQNVGVKPTSKPTNNNSTAELDALRQEIERLRAEISKKQETPQISIEEAFNIGNDYYYGRNGKPKDYAEAVKWYHKAAEQGDASAQYNLGVCYDNGVGVTQSYTEAVKWYHKAAEQGHADAQYNLGVCYKNGQGVTQDYAEAVKWYRKAAEQGYAYAQYNLGICYHNGEGVTQSYTEAVKWYHKAAEQGDADALNNLGVRYLKGQGVEKDIDKAIELYQQAARQGHETAQKNLKELGKSW